MGPNWQMTWLLGSINSHHFHRGWSSTQFRRGFKHTHYIIISWYFIIRIPILKVGPEFIPNKRSWSILSTYGLECSMNMHTVSRSAEGSMQQKLNSSPGSCSIASICQRGAQEKDQLGRFGKVWQAFPKYSANNHERASNVRGKTFGKFWCEVNGPVDSDVFGPL